MTPDDPAAAHFVQMRHLAEALHRLPAEVLRHECDFDTFGSWSLTLRHRGEVLQFVYDGRDAWLGLRRSRERKPPYTFDPSRAVGHAGQFASLGERQIEEICLALVTRSECPPLR
jgi:hypothetical protein